MTVQAENQKSKVKAYLALIDEVNSKGRFKPDWASLAKVGVPRWYRDAKFGVFIHWGVYSVPAFGNEWYPHTMYKKGSPEFEHHVKTYGPHRNFGYKDFIPMFKAEKFDPDEWARLFAEAGARFVMPVAEHHDGFQMYDSDLSGFCAAKMGPGRDVVGELKKAVEARGMVFAASSHRVEHYFFMAWGRDFDSDVADPQYGELYWPAVQVLNGDYNELDVEADAFFMEDWLARTCELADKYRPKVVWFDWWIQVEPMKPYLKKFAAYYYNRAGEWGEEVAINYKYDAFAPGTAVNDIERGQLSQVSPDFWQCDTSVARNSWSYTENNDYKAPADIVCDLVDIVSKNGALLLNIGPKADGMIPDGDKNILLAIGKWLKINGEGVYGTTYWKKYGEGPTETPEGHFTDTRRKGYTPEDFRFTYKDGSVYAFAMAWPEDGVVRIKALGSEPWKCAFHGIVKNVRILGFDGKMEWVRCKEHLTVIAPGLKKSGGFAAGYPVCVKVTVE
ncbi:MAG: alpha-L-fucosidase [Firmicutes bacterium]|nr:alpha-L-fucosidase [Bacillota bacterium]